MGLVEASRHTSFAFVFAQNGLYVLIGLASVRQAL